MDVEDGGSFFFMFFVIFVDFIIFLLYFKLNSLKVINYYLLKVKIHMTRFYSNDLK